MIGKEKGWDISSSDLYAIKSCGPAAHLFQSYHLFVMTVTSLDSIMHFPFASSGLGLVVAPALPLAGFPELF